MPLLFDRALGKSEWPSSCIFNRQMLPSSHLLPINDHVSDDQADLEDCGPSFGSQGDWGNFSKREMRVDAESTTRGSAGLLADAFSEFISSASRLEDSYRDLQGEVYGLTRELADRNDALKGSLEENERMRLALQQIVDSMPCGVIVVEHNGQISLINPESERMLGLDNTLINNESPITLHQVGTWSGINLELSYQSVLSSHRGQEFCIHDSLGMRWLEVRNRRLRHRLSHEGVPDQTILILQDITAQKHAENERDSSRKAMALAEVSTVLAHEIRNPLASLELFAELIEQDGEHIKEWISNLRAGIRSLAGTVNNVLSFHGSGSLNLTPVSLATIIGNSIEFVRPLADQAAVSLSWSGARCPAVIMGNGDALQQVVLNLVSNAIRHTPSGGSVSVSLLADNIPGNDSRTECIVVQFSDTGCGIPLDHIDRVFEQGFSGNGDTSGLGLAVCERIMKLHGGEISVVNLPHAGARFTLHFPLRNLEGVTE
jgi:two-component system, sensor histidine kinase FlrB